VNDEMRVAGRGCALAVHSIADAVEFIVWVNDDAKKLKFIVRVNDDAKKLRNIGIAIDHLEMAETHIRAAIAHLERERSR